MIKKKNRAALRKNAHCTKALKKANNRAKNAKMHRFHGYGFDKTQKKQAGDEPLLV